MASSRQIRISITSALNAAGIEATKQQINALSGELQKFNQKNAQGGKEVAQSWAKLPGVFGKIQTSLGGLSAKFLAVIGAFKTGWDIGTWINEKVIRPLFGIKDPIEELKRQNRELRKEAEAAAAAFMKAQEAFSQSIDRQTAQAEKGISVIDKMTAAYIRLQDAKKAVADENANAEILGLQRDKFNDMAMLSNNGEDAKAAQVGKYYDVLIAEAKAEQEIGEAESKRARIAAEIEGREKSIAKLKLSERLAEEKYLEAAARVQKIENGELLPDAHGKDYDAALAAAKRDASKALSRWDKIAEQRKGRESELDAMRLEENAAATARENAAKAAELEIDRRKKDYDDYIAEVERKDAEAAMKRAKADEEEAENRRRLDRAEAERRIDERIREHQQILAEEQKSSQNAAAARLAAESKLQQAWGWYRNKDSMAAQIAEEKADAEARKQYEKDFKRLRDRRRDWRTAENLSVDDEAVRRVALAREEKEQADRHLAEIEKNTSDLAEKIDTLLQMKGG